MSILQVHLGGGFPQSFLSIPSDVHGSKPSDCPSILASHHQHTLQLPKEAKDVNGSYHMGNLEEAECEGVQQQVHNASRVHAEN